MLNPAQANARPVLSAGAGAPQVIFECVGVEGTLQQAMDVAGLRSRIIIVGVCMVTDQIWPMVGINKQLRFEFVSAYTPEEIADSLAGIAAGTIDAARLVTRTVRLPEFSMPSARSATRTTAR